MEVELKYLVTDKLVSEKILQDKYLVSIMDKDSREIINMDAVYFDTKDRVLSDAKIAFRVRKEGNKIIATLKWNGSADEGLHTREEINIPVADESFMNAPSIHIYDESPIEGLLKNLVGEKKLIPLFEMNFIRNQMRVDTGKSISEISLDKGEIKSKNGSAKILELEIELYSGSQDDIKELGEDLRQRYNLVPENTSKYKRGLDLL